jgi:hypothetical protein
MMMGRMGAHRQRQAMAIHNREILTPLPRRVGIPELSALARIRALDLDGELPPSAYVDYL